MTTVARAFGIKALDIDDQNQTVVTAEVSSSSLSLPGDRHDFWDNEKPAHPEYLAFERGERACPKSITLNRNGKRLTIFASDESAEPTAQISDLPRDDVDTTPADGDMPAPNDDAGRARSGIDWGQKRAPANMPAEVISFYDRARREETSSYDPFRDDPNEIQCRVKYLHGDTP